MRKIFGFLCLISFPAYAAGPGFTNLTQKEFKDLIEDFGSSYIHTSVSPASSLGNLWGFEVGLIVGSTKADAVRTQSKRLDPGSDVSVLPHAGFLGVLTFPYGITGELNVMPTIKNSDVDFSTGSLGIKWTFTEIWPLPVDMAVKLHTAGSSVKWNQTVSAAATDVEYKQQVSGLMFEVSKKFGIFEPYVNLGSVKATGKMAVKGSGTVFDPSYTTDQSAKASVSGGMFMLGFNVNFLFVKLGLELGKVLDNSRGSLKASLYF